MENLFFFGAVITEMYSAATLVILGSAIGLSSYVSSLHDMTAL
jgi:hypothetical protein